MKLELGEMRWPEVRDLLGQNHVVLLPVGATEQHGKHLPLNTDTLCAEYLSRRTAEIVGEQKGIRVVLAPTIPYGETGGTPPFEKPLPGTITISPDTAIALVEEVVRCLVDEGFKNVLVINGHLENTILISVALRKVALSYPNAGLYAVNWFQLAGKKWSQIRQGGEGGGGHSCEKETAVDLVLQPQNVDMGAIEIGDRTFSLPERYVLPMGKGPVYFHSRISGTRVGGHMGDPSVATKETGEALIEAVLEELTEIVVSIATSGEGETKEQF